MTTKIKVIRTKEDYGEALKLIEKLMLMNPEANTEESEKLSLLATLVHDYESKTFTESMPDPIDAIMFRMEQQNLKSIDLVPYIGSRSKVSEVLSRKRPLTLSMIRALEVGLGIPAKVLVQESDEFRNADNITWGRFPLKEMRKRKYLPPDLPKGLDLRKLMESFFQPVGPPEKVIGLLRKSNYRTARTMDKYALVVWSAQVVKKAKRIRNVGKFRHKSINLTFMQKLVKLSVYEDGPIRAANLLRDFGIALIVEPHFPQTYLDGATIMRRGDSPIIGLTLRHNRLDNFWYTLMHELAHVSLHYGSGLSIFYDDLDNPDLASSQEQNADRLAGEALVTDEVWQNSPAKLIPSPIAAESLARELGIHITIVAGKMRHESGRYTYLTSIVNNAKVRQHFPKEKWSK